MLPTEDKYGVWPKSGEIDVRPSDPCQREGETWANVRSLNQGETTTHTADKEVIGDKEMIASNPHSTGDR